MRSLLIIPVVLALSMADGHAQTAEPPATPAPQPPAAEPSIHGYADRDKTCTAWTDKCRSCDRADDDTVHCSNIGIACQPAEITCTARRSEPAK